MTGLHRRLAEAPAALMRSRFIVPAQPGVKIGLQLVERAVHLLAERHPIELVERKRSQMPLVCGLLVLG
jgi:hypothetical protein